MSRMPRAAAIAIAALLSVGLLGGCTASTAHSGGWRPLAACPEPADVATVSGLTGLDFTVKSKERETLATTGCAYRAGDVALDVESDPGAPGDVQFGAGPGVTTHSEPALGDGAKSATSPALCALVVPERRGRTLQLQLIGSVTHLPACDRMPRLMALFATRPKGS